ncbi:MAG: PhzF family phenazine biosynthesis protein [Salinisphaera sp.]|jgi:PhzF family phenazine biosynthesis protein|nr:PhzF family phenazine biosynthesis protein [Salinisphaera sp.]
MHRFSQVDVFTDRFLLGNALAVVHDADDLSEDEMAAFARWTNLAETTFLLTPTEPSADYRLRIFTPSVELPFAGHPTIGSARAWLRAGGQPANHERLIQQCAAGQVELRRAGDRLAFAAPPLIRSGPVDADDLATIARGLGIVESDIVDSQWVDNGPGWVALLLASAEQVLAVEPDYGVLAGLNLGVVGPQPESSDTAFELRAFIADRAAKEDPVTGSLNASVARWLIDSGRAPASYVAAQGTRLARRGRIYIDDAADGLWVGGDSVIGIVGELAL